MRKIYGKTIGFQKQVFFKTDLPDYQGQESSDLIYDELMSSKPSMISRFGSVELEALKYYKFKKERKTNKVFIATNNIRAIKNSKLKEYVLYDINNDNPINTFIEQYICCCSTVFIMSKYNDYRKTNEQHIRSTWSSFVYDYRLFKNNNKNNIYIQSIL